MCIYVYDQYRIFINLGRLGAYFILFIFSFLIAQECPLTRRVSERSEEREWERSMGKRYVFTVWAVALATTKGEILPH